MNNNPTKQEEIDHFKKFVNDLPQNSYLHSMFNHAPNMIEQMIRNDFAYDPINEIINQQKEEQNKLNEITNKLNALKEELHKTSTTLQNIKEQARKIAELS
jgi:K+/H+ antiporter YhaU regulatory subunit KhtT